MNRTEKVVQTIQSLKKITGDWTDYITTKEVAQYMRRSSPATARKYTYGLKKYGRQYYIPDVAERIVDSGERDI